MLIKLANIGNISIVFLIPSIVDSNNFLESGISSIVDGLVPPNVSSEDSASPAEEKENSNSYISSSPTIDDPSRVNRRSETPSDQDSSATSTVTRPVTRDVSAEDIDVVQRQGQIICHQLTPEEKYIVDELSKLPA